jgi:uroporphyrinogen-III decarboxylase
MSDFRYPKGNGDLSTLQINPNPFPAQIRALELIRDGIGSQNYFVETIFNPWSVAEHLTSRQHLLEIKASQPQKLMDTLDVITRSEVNHARLAVNTGAHGIFLAIQNATPDVLTVEEYAKFSEPFDKQILSAVSGAPLNVLHLHGSRIYWRRFTHGWAAAGINYSAVTTRVPIAEVRAQYTGLIVGGIDEGNFPKLSFSDLRRQALEARQSAGRHFLLTPGCSVPNNTTVESVRRLETVYA